MDRTRRICLTAAGAGAVALVLFRHRAVVTNPVAGDGVTVVRGGDAPQPVALTTAAVTSPELAAWQAQVGQPVTLSGGGRRFAASIAAVLPFARPQPAMRTPAAGRWWGWLTTGGQGAAPSAVAAASTTASLPAGVRPYAYSVLIAIESGPAPAADMLMDLDRPIEGLRQLFVQPATAMGGKPMVAAWFG